MLHRASVAACIAALVVAISLTTLSLTSMAATPTDASAESPGCFVSGEGYLRARLRGAVDLDLDWRNADMDCAGGPRPRGDGVRVSIGGPVRGDGRRIRIVFGISDAGEGTDGRNLRTNVTVLFEGEQRIFATQGDDKCTVDSLVQKRVETLGSGRAVYRAEARGFCVGPATSLSRGERMYITTFDFAGRVEFGDDDRHDKTRKPA